MQHIHWSCSRKKNAKRRATGLLAAPQGSVSDGTLPRALFPSGPEGASFGLKDSRRWQQPPALSCRLLLGEQHADRPAAAGATATPNISARLRAAPCSGLKSRLCKYCFLLPSLLQARSSVLTDPAWCAVAHLHMHGSSDTSWIWCTCWEWLYPACAKTQPRRRGKKRQHVILRLAAAWLDC